MAAMNSEKHYFIIAHARCSTRMFTLKSQNHVVFYAQKGQLLGNKLKPGMTDGKPYNWELDALDLFVRMAKKQEYKTLSLETMCAGSENEMVFTNDDDVEAMGVFDSTHKKVMIIPRKPGIYLSDIIKTLPVIPGTTNVVHVIACRNYHGVKPTKEKTRIGGKKQSRRTRKTYLKFQRN